MKKTVLNFALVIGLTVATSSVFAGVCDPGPDFDFTDCQALGNVSGAPGNVNGASTVPIDGGAGFLIAGAFAYGAKRFRASKTVKA